MKNERKNAMRNKRMKEKMKEKILLWGGKIPIRSN